MTCKIFLYYDIENKESAYRLAKKMQKQGYKITEEVNNCITLIKEL